MKKLIGIFLSVIFCAISVQAQDYIYMKDGSEYKAKVQEITPDIIKFVKFDQLEGPVRTVKVADVISIRYQDGTEDAFGKTIPDKKAQEPEDTQDQYVYNYNDRETETEKGNKVSKFELNGHDKYVSLGGGFGNSYGGAGTRFQFRVGGIVGFGLHTGLGMYPLPFNTPGTGSFQKRLQFDFGVKLFCYKWIYVDFQLGMVGRDNNYYLYETGADRFLFNNVLFGPAILAGADYIIGKHLGINVGAGVSFPITGVSGNGNGGPPSPQTKTYPAIDTGIFYKF